MATFFRVLVLILLFSDSLMTGNHSFRIGINYGRVANNLPTPSHVASFIVSLNITRVRIFDADPEVLSAFANTSVELTIGLEDKYIENFTNPALAKKWVQQNVAPYTNQTNIKLTTIGNEVLTGKSIKMMLSLVPAMRNVQKALADLGLSKKIYVTTVHSYDIMDVSFPPSSGKFKDKLVAVLADLLVFLFEIESPFVMNVNPYFAYSNDPNHVLLNYVLFEPNPGQTDPITNLHYDNMLDAQIDAVYSALNTLYAHNKIVYTTVNASAFRNLAFRLGETGWPSGGHIKRGVAPMATGANVTNAMTFNGNLLKRVEEKQGTPMRPSVPIDVYLFALFDEDLKPGPETEMHYGLFYPNMTPVYDIGLQVGGGGGGGAIQRVDHDIGDI